MNTNEHALESLKWKKYKDMSNIEFCIIEYSKKYPALAEKAAAELSAMQARIEKLAEYPERLQKAITELEALHPHTSAEGSRILAKIEGVKLALGYFEEMTR